MRILFNIGRRLKMSEKVFQEHIRPLALDKASVAFCNRLLLERVDSLQREHWNNGAHIRFRFQNEREQDRLYSIMWEENQEEP